MGRLILMKHSTLLFLSGLLFSATSHATECQQYGRHWSSYANAELGLEFCYPSRFTVQTDGEYIYVEKKRPVSQKGSVAISNKAAPVMNGPMTQEDREYVLTIKVDKGDFATGNAKEGIFVKDKGGIRADIGRFRNPIAEKVQEGGWTGYKTEIICGTDDPQTGFHAAGGSCLWVLGSNGRRYFVLNTSGEESDIAPAWKITKSLRLINKL